MISRIFEESANEIALPANQGEKEPKNPAKMKGECYSFHSLLYKFIESLLLHI